MIVVTLLRAEERINEIEHVSGRSIHADTWKEKLMKSTGLDGIFPWYKLLVYIENVLFNVATFIHYLS